MTSLPIDQNRPAKCRCESGWTKEVVTDNGLVTSRSPKDLEAFNKKMIERDQGGQHAPAAYTPGPVIDFQCMNIKKAVIGNNHGFSLLSFQPYRIIKRL